ncbi:Serine/threonine-protein kinase tel1 [Marasmius tenuissimus]|uniref:Serine/threonine-protein kinase Tel1 n=1 Tax=Marasmius tenuissimus TaxID=585030 RepID=A0ABR2ZVP3_9AGAR
MGKNDDEGLRKKRQKAALTVRRICDSLSSDKIKERQEGLENLKTAFSSDIIINNFGITEGGKSDANSWLALFQSLFRCVHLERTAATKNTTQSVAAAERRLAEAARTVRWLIEKTRRMVNRKVTTPLYDHLSQSIIHKNELLGPLVLDYVKSLESLLGFTPHLEHLKTEKWLELVELSFNVILGDGLRTTFDEDDGLDATESAAPSPAPTTHSDDMYIEDSLMDVDEEEVGTPRPKKRRRGETPQPSGSRATPASSRPSRSSGNRIAVTPEQVAFTSLLATLISSPYAPFGSADYPYVTSCVLSRLVRFLQMYPTDTTLHHDFLRILTSTLTHISYNNTSLMTTFARKSWESLVKLWDTKNKSLKEGLISVFRVLFPFLTSRHKATGTEYSEMLWSLWNVLDIEGGNKWGLEVLSMDNLRLDLSHKDGKEAFVASVFRSGDAFDRLQAMTWAILELQADCAEKLYHHSESVHSVSSSSRSNQGWGKRARVENPLTSILTSIRTTLSSNSRIYHLQILLFFIDRHWAVLNRSTKQEVFTTLLQLISVDDKDGAVQNWIMLCFAAIASADFSSGENSPYLSSTPASSFSSLLPLYSTQALRDAPPSWELVWTHAIRRTNSSAFCRAACHTALAIMSHPDIQSTRKSFKRPPLSPQRVVTDLEALLKDLDVQGPSSPCDSVCSFLSLSLRVVNQDVRIFRLQLEEKVLSWLTGFWQLGHIDPHAVQLYLVKDILTLLETICTSSKHSALICETSLPPCLTAETLVNMERLRIIRGFVLEARLPEFSPNASGGELPRSMDPYTTHIALTDIIPSEADVIEPRAREKRISSFFLKTLESLTSHWHPADQDNPPRAEWVKQVLDIVVISLAFEAVLYLNGVRWDRRLIHAACRLIGLVAPVLESDKWTLDEKCSVLHALEPLVSTGMKDDNEPPWVAMLTARASTGVRYEVLRTLIPETTTETTLHSTTRHLRLLWSNFEVQSCFSDVFVSLRAALENVVSQGLEDGGKAFDADDKDGFGPIKTAENQIKGDLLDVSDSESTFICFMKSCIKFLSVAPLLQSPSGEPTRDQALIEVLLDSSPNALIQCCGILLGHVRQSTLVLSINNLDDLLAKWTELVRMYLHNRSPQFFLLGLALLDASMNLWIGEGAANAHVDDLVRDMLDHFVQGYDNGILTWSIRDSLARLLEKCLASDPSQQFWRADKDCDRSSWPSSVLQRMNGDEDVRVRFRAAVISARLFEFAARVGEAPMTLYGKIREYYSADIDSYECMITRILSLGNIMIVSSAVRRGPYWHLLELCFHSDVYTSHMESTLREVARRIGLEPFSALFEAYASQIAFSIRQAGQNVLRIPYHLLGYKDAKERAVATFRLFTPANLHGRGAAIEHGQQLFRGHCETIQKRPEDGMWECFGEIFAHEMLSRIAQSPNLDEPLSQPWDDSGFMQQLTSAFKRPESDIKRAIHEKLDCVVSSMLRAIGDQDFSVGGPLRAALGVGSTVSAIFEKLTAYRTPNDFALHEPNLPKYDIRVVLVALHRTLRATEVDLDALTYHVLQELSSSVESSQIVNEQIRLANAITVWLALQHERFRSHTLLHAAIRGQCALLAQVDLARSAQSVLEWCFDRYRANAHQDARFPDVLVKVACVCCEYTKDSHNATVSATGSDLLAWIDQQAVKLSNEAGFAGQVQIALTAWPHPVPTELHDLSSTISIRDLSEILGENRVPSNKFRIVQRLYQETSTKEIDPSQFAQYDFWNLKECIPPIDRLGIDDVLSFASLLLANKGSISSFGSDLLSSAKPRQHGQGSGGRTGMPELSIILPLLSLLERGDSKRRHAAYRTLHALLVALKDQPDMLRSCPSQYNEEIHFLRSFDPLVSTPEKRELAELNSEGFLDASKSFEGWVGRTAILLSSILSVSKPFYAQLPFILRSDALFAERALPILVQTLLQDPDRAKSQDYSSILSVYFSSVLSSKYADVACRKCIIEIVLHLRNITPNSKDALSYEKWLTIDHLLLAQNAIACGAYTTALLFLELGDDVRRSVSHTLEESSAYDTAVEKVMYNIYANIDEPDGFYGIKAQNHKEFLIKRFHHEEQWEKAFRFHGAALEADTKNVGEAEGLLQSFHSYGFDHLATSTLLNSVAPEKPNLALNYQLGWRTETWDLPDLDDDHSSGASLYLALRAIHRERDHNVSKNVVKDVLFREMAYLRSLGSENVAQIRETTQNLMSLSQVRTWMTQPTKTPGIVCQIFPESSAADSGFQFSDICSIMATRISLLRSARHREERQQIGSLRSPLSQALLETEKKCLLRLSSTARQMRHCQISLNSVTRAGKLEDTPSFSVCEEYASVLWEHQEEKLAVDLLKDLRAKLPAASTDDAGAAMQRALLNACLGEWTAQACLEKHSTIWKDCFEAAIASLHSTVRLTQGEDRASVYHKAAIFAEHQYYAIVRSPDAIRWRVYSERKRKEIEQLNAQSKKAPEHSDERKEIRRLIERATKVMKQDKQANDQQTADRQTYLKHAVDMYSRCLEESDSFDQDTPIRLSSLWLANFEEPNMHEHFASAIDRVPSRKFIFLAHQLTARLSIDSPAQKVLQRLIRRMGQEHPFHTLYQVFLLNPPREDVGSSRRSSVRNMKSPSPGTQTERANAAKGILDGLRSDSNRQERLLAVEQLCFASLQWADYPIKNNKDIKTGPYDIPANQAILKLKHARMKVPVITVHTPVDSTMRYDNCIWVDRYDGKYSTAGGLSKPKICACRGSDGKSYKQLFKGEESDDLRQDAVMEQVFQLVNTVLQRDPETRRRQLRVRDYKVIPLDTQAGVLEFVHSTIPLRGWLAGAHPKYRPQDRKDVAAWWSRLSRENGNRETHPDPGKRLQIYRETRAVYKPVMRYWFTEKHKLPISWFGMRLNYSRSVATTSIVGHVLGLGDRHTSNILLDNTSGEVVHIDLGLAFDQAKLLPVPELVPFRMTEDMEDGMGMSGTEGVFQRCAEETMRVLREGSEIIMTVLEVFRHDPLHSWTMTDLKIQKVQQQPKLQPPFANPPGLNINMSSDNAEEDADRALNSVARKLDKTLSVATVVRGLVAEAKDPANLASLFHGWGPYY